VERPRSANLHLLSRCRRFCTDYCGWHASGVLLNTTVRFAVVGDPSGCASVSACTTLTADTAPNKALGADAMASVLLHEIVEVMTDPDLQAWYDSSGLENADKCAWTFGDLTTVAGRTHNIVLGGAKMLIQQNWVLPTSGSFRGGFCAMQR